MPSPGAPFWPAWNDGAVEVYVGKNKLFSLWEDFFNGPVLIYPFADGKRFLCDYNNDTVMLDFVVDFGVSSTNEVGLPKWPTDDYVRTHLLNQATNIVFETKGVVRLPSYAELQEVSRFLTNTNPRQIKTATFSIFDCGTKKRLLADLATNRQSCWPVVK